MTDPSESQREFNRLAAKLASDGVDADLFPLPATRKDIIELGLGVVSALTKMMQALAALNEGDGLTYSAQYFAASERVADLQSTLLKLALAGEGPVDVA